VDKLRMMQEDTVFDVSDDDAACVPDFSQIKAEFKAKPSPPKVPKIMLSNNCIFNCAYCGCRAGNDERNRYTNDPRELAEMAVQQAQPPSKVNPIGTGIFITSAICKNADYTEELIVETVKHIRKTFAYKGYVHAKIMPGADPELIRQAGQYANRLSVNIEVAKSEGYKRIARNKNRDNILEPMGSISKLIQIAKHEKSKYSPYFATSQTTQMMAGAADETDYDILRLANAMYNKYDLKRVYYTAFQYKNPARGYDGLSPVKTPVWRMKRLYQADRLMQIYGFTPEDIAPDGSSFLEYDLDPKAAWALRHIDMYPVEVNTADYEELLRVPGIGTVYAQRILKARKYCKITHDVLRMLGVKMKRAKHFMTCNGRFDGVSRGGIETYRDILARPLADTADNWIGGGNCVEDC